MYLPNHTYVKKYSHTFLNYLRNDPFIFSKKYLIEIIAPYLCFNMSFHVRTQRSRLWESMTTYMTGIWFFTRVCTHVCFQYMWTNKTFLADITFMWFHPRVTHHVYTEGTVCKVSFRTQLTSIWTFAGMIAHVCIQIAFLQKCSATVGASVRFLSCMSSSMDCQLTSTCKTKSCTFIF